MITAEDITAIAGAVEKLGLSDQSLVELRAGHPDVHFTYCMDDDIGSYSPHLERESFNIYLVDGREHCLKFTTELAHATGVVLAEVIQDDG
ncbi:DUF6129 family protein [Methylomagnum sp.]